MGFGGGGSRSQPTTTTQTSVQELSPEQRELLQLAIPKAKAFVESPPRLAPGSSIAPITGLEQEAQRMLLGAARGPLRDLSQGAVASQNFLNNPLATRGLVSDNTVRDRLLSSVNLPNAMLNPALSAAAEAATRPIIQNFQRNVLPSIRSSAVAAGGFGSSRQGIAEGIASEGLLRSVGDVGAQFANQALRDVLQAETARLATSTGAETARLSEASRASTAAGQTALETATRSLLATPQTASLLLQPSQLVGAVGSQERAENQARITERVNRFLAEQLIPFSAAQEVASLAFGIPAGSVTATAQGPGPTRPGGFQQALGFGSLGASIGGSIGGPFGAGIGAGLGALASLFV